MNHPNQRSTVRSARTLRHPSSVLRFTNCQSELMDETVAEIVRRIEKKVDIKCEFVHQPHWLEREAMFDAGEIDVAWICGIWYARRVDAGRGLQLISAPVMEKERYGDIPQYFSDVVVKKGSPLRNWDDLKGCHWAINETGSHSGTNVVASVLAREGLDWSFFGQITESSAHSASLQGIIDGRYDAAAIDSTVFDQIVEDKPAVLEKVESIVLLGPSPMPPFVLNGGNHQLGESLTQAFLSLQIAPFSRFARVRDQDYDPIREMMALVREKGLEEIPNLAHQVKNVL